MAEVHSSKRERLAAWAARVGLTRAVEMLPNRQTLIVLNYHRIGGTASGFDPGALSATVEDFDWQVAWLKSRFAMLTLDESIAWLERPAASRPVAVLIAFDDGCLDNYRLATAFRPTAESTGPPGPIASTSAVSLWRPTRPGGSFVCAWPSRVAWVGP